MSCCQIDQTINEGVIKPPHLLKGKRSVVQRSQMVGFNDHIEIRETVEMGFGRPGLAELGACPVWFMFFARRWVASKCHGQNALMCA